MCFNLSFQFISYFKGLDKIRDFLALYFLSLTCNFINKQFQIIIAVIVLHPIRTSVTRRSQIMCKMPQKWFIDSFAFVSLDFFQEIQNISANKNYLH